MITFVVILSYNQDFKATLTKSIARLDDRFFKT
jgi:hypothetical protein